MGNSVLALFPGCCAMFIAAVRVSVGVVPPLGVAAGKSCVQAFLAAPADPKGTLTHAARIFPRVFSFAVGMVAPAGSEVVLSCPYPMLTRVLTEAKAFANPTELPGLVPMFVGPVMNGASAHTEATVVSSFIVMKDALLRLLQRPSAASMMTFGLLSARTPSGDPPTASI